MQWNTVAQRHYDWVEAMGWHNKTVLEALALIGSEIGEVAGEIDDEGRVNTSFGEELADIVLRTLDLALTEHVDIDTWLGMVTVPMNVSAQPVHVQLCGLMQTFGHWVNSARAERTGADFAQALAQTLARVKALAESQHVDLAAEVERKILKNLERGTRGRRI